MSSKIELSVSDDVYIELQNAAECHFTSLNEVCEEALSNYLIRYFEDTIPHLGLNPDTKARLAKESKQELYAMCYEGLIESKREQGAKREGNMVRLEKPDIHPTLKDFLSIQKPPS